jgi:hypothetical protein
MVFPSSDCRTAAGYKSVSIRHLDTGWFSWSGFVLQHMLRWFRHGKLLLLASQAAFNISAHQN